MDTSTLLIALGCLVFYSLILIFIISAATQTSKRIAQNELQVRILMLIARKLNASEDELNDALDGK